MWWWSNVTSVNMDLPNFATDTAQIRVTVCMGFMSFTLLIWDHIVTLGDEIQYIWMGRKGFVVYLFLLNRYLTPLGFIINLFAYLSPTWTREVLAGSSSPIAWTDFLKNSPRCDHFVRYEGSMTVIGINVVALMMLCRIRAMYARQLWIVFLVACIWLIELGVNTWLLTKGQAVQHDSGIHACTMIFDSSVHVIASASAWLPLTYDTVVFLLTLHRTVISAKNQPPGSILNVLLKEGIVYYSVIFGVNLVLTIMIKAAPPGLQNITAQLEYLLTVAMMSRITLHLKKQGRFNGDSSEFPVFHSLSRAIGGEPTHGTSIITRSLHFSSFTSDRDRDDDRRQHMSGGGGYGYGYYPNRVRGGGGDTGSLSVNVHAVSVVHDDDGRVLDMDERVLDIRGGGDRKMGESYELQERGMV